MTKIKFLVADCGHIIRADNLGGKCSKCGKLCCKDCLIRIDSEMLCPKCLKENLKSKKSIHFRFPFFKLLSAESGF